jgi:polyphosphate kinase 2
MNLVRSCVVEGGAAMAKKGKHKYHAEDDGVLATEDRAEEQAGHHNAHRHGQRLNGNRETRAPMSRKEYEKALRPLQVELVKLQTWAKQTGFRAIVVFEGRDAAGKGGCIKAISERVSPRVFRIVALPAPTEREKSQMYLQRYMEHFPSAGEIMLFDRSWYNRAGVEHVLGYCTDEQYQGFLRITPETERVVIQSGIALIKYWLEVSQEEQTRRFEERIHDGRKTWKLSPQDLESHRLWYDYSRARDAMFAATDTEESPWHIIDAEDQKRARLNCIAHLLSQIPYEEISSKTARLPKRQSAEGYVEPAWRRHPVPHVY